MSNIERRFGLRCRENLKLRSQKVCKKCKRNFFPSSYSEYDSDIEDDEICISCNAEQMIVKQSKPPLPSIAQQSSKTSISAIHRQSNILPAYKYIIPTSISQKTLKPSNNTTKSSSTIENVIKPALSKVHTKVEFKGTIKFERATKRPATSRSIELSSVPRKLPDPNEENEDAETDRAAISFQSMPSLDSIDDFIAALPINNNNNRTKIMREKKQPQKNIPTNTNNNSLESVTASAVQLKKSLTNIQLEDEQICLTSTGKTNTKTKSASIKPPAATRVSTRIRKTLVPFGSNWSPASASGFNEHEEQIPSAKRAKTQRTSTQTKPNEGNAYSQVQPVAIDHIKEKSRDPPTNKVDILDMIIIHSRVHPSKEKEITSSESKWTILIESKIVLN